MRARLLLAAVMAQIVLCNGPALAGTLRDDVRAWRKTHEKAILEEFDALLRLPNVATRVPDIEANADRLQSMLEARGLAVRRLSAGPGTPPAVYAELPVKGATRTVVYYAHYDGQPVTPPQWRSDPFVPVMRDGAREVDWRGAAEPLDPEWRFHARSASDDKAPILAILAALDALKASGRVPSVNVKIFLDGEEEQGSPHVRSILEAHKDLLEADLWLFGDGPVHQSRRPQLYFGVRGVLGLEMTVYGPMRALHSGHYGNWAPNPAVMAAELLASMRDSEGRILIPGLDAGVRPLTPAEVRALAALPEVEGELRDSLALGRTEGSQRLADSLMRPALNVRGMACGAVGESAANAIPTEARISIDFRLVPDQKPEAVRRAVETFLQARGYKVLHEPPDAATRKAAPRLVELEWEEGGYAAQRTDLDFPASRAVIAAAGRPVILPMLGGSLPMRHFAEVFGVPVIGLPIVNHDNNQHAADENLRLQNLWDGIELYAALLADLRW
ncbi:MAG TPA: M20/M25/M40 family metallo-hydrolase [Candidatus Polarisedimenticolaceae bacterium]|nr:M20/M25/M40 family metallo-hydrolase [Candidatus Polarisedimenticolaceae bacterium]